MTAARDPGAEHHEIHVARIHGQSQVTAQRIAVKGAIAGALITACASVLVALTTGAMGKRGEEKSEGSGGSQAIQEQTRFQREVDRLQRQVEDQKKMIAQLAHDKQTPPAPGSTAGGFAWAGDSQSCKARSLQLFSAEGLSLEPDNGGTQISGYSGSRRALVICSSRTLVTMGAANDDAIQALFYRLRDGLQAGPR